MTDDDKALVEHLRSVAECQPAWPGYEIIAAGADRPTAMCVRASITREASK